MGGGFTFDKCHIAELPIKPKDPTEAIVLHVEDPFSVFLAHGQQIDMVTTISEQVS